MNQLIITADLIRRFPFAVAPHRITDELEILIARDMAKQAHAEGQKGALPKDPPPNNVGAKKRAVDAEASVWRRLMLGDTAMWQLVQNTTLTRETIERVLGQMVDDGRVEKQPPLRRGQGFQFVIHPDHWPEDA